ncbi:colanic acid biosynthesis glycosyltransferase WcaL [Gramella sp. MT6]|uniref:glycosyltransferase n=1 Tax=Gramella sp. MT6 TaxID=2705471 RepID=UPI001C5DB063|nr:glycosyltransferase [Gramella sp. MT6]QYA24027.1 colanic acid biosynthesis glycosyltransferase WcaL [Gramella sp. MT6]
MSKEKLKIAFIVSHFPVISQTFIYNQIADLIERGHEVKIYALDHNCEAIRHQNIKDYNLEALTTFKEIKRSTNWEAFSLLLRTTRSNIRYFNPKKFIQKFRFFSYQTKNFDLQFFNENFWILKDQNFDIIHAHFGESGMFVADLKRAGFFSKAKFVTTFHGYDLNPSKLHILKERYAKLFREVDLMTVNSSYSKSLLEQLFNKKEIQILPVGLNTKKFKKEAERSRNLFQILFVGRLIELKAPLLALQIIPLLIAKGINDFKLILAGDGELEEEINEYIIKNNLESFVECIGAVSQEKVVQLMNDADVFILPGVYDREGRAETQGLVIQEAQSMELPVLISDAGGMKYGVVDGKTGFVIKENDLNEFANKLEILQNDNILRREMGKEGRAYVKKNFDSRVLGDRLEKVYFQLLN